MNIIPGSVFTKFYRQGKSYAIGTIIDAYLDDKTCSALYSKWKKNWPAPLEFQGGESAITCEMILDIPSAEFLKVYGNQMSVVILEAARANSG